jgi:hypothetical protein
VGPSDDSAWSVVAKGRVVAIDEVHESIAAMMLRLAPWHGGNKPWFLQIMPTLVTASDPPVSRIARCPLRQQHVQDRPTDRRGRRVLGLEASPLRDAGHGPDRVEGVRANERLADGAGFRAGHPAGPDGLNGRGQT